MPEDIATEGEDNKAPGATRVVVVIVVSVVVAVRDGRT